MNLTQLSLTIRSDIRTLYIMFVLSFIERSSIASVKSAFLEQHRDALTLIFKGLEQDPFRVVRLVLEVCWTGIWSDQKLRRTLKVSLFTEFTLAHVGLHPGVTPPSSDLDR